jgi:hypothetical protein
VAWEDLSADVAAEFALCLEWSEIDKEERESASRARAMVSGRRGALRYYRRNASEINEKRSWKNKDAAALDAARARQRAAWQKNAAKLNAGRNARLKNDPEYAARVREIKRESARRRRAKATT